MIFSPFPRTVCAGALAAGLGLAALVPASASAQPSAQLDGYCYVRQSDMQRNSAVDSYGVKRSFARCYNGIYYAYSGESFSAPAAPDGYQVAYYTRRPGAEYYDRVVDADTRYASSSRYSTSTYTGGDRYATTSGYGSSAYGSTAYGDDSRYGRGSDAYDDDRYDNESYGDDRYGRRGGDRYQGDDRDYTRRTTVEGWRDDSGQWHTGRPRAIGWQDDSGRWHVGEVEAYGWRDARGQWHESRDDSDDTESRSGY
jgi:hypothetical protein